MGLEELTKFGMKNSLTLPSLAIKQFNSLTDENDETLYTYTDSFMRNFVRNSIKSGRYKAFIQHYKSENSDEGLNCFSKELDDNVNLCKILVKYFQFLNKYEKLYAKEIDSKFKVYRDSNQKEKEKFNIKILNMLPIQKQLSKLGFNNTQMDFDATSLYPSAMWDNLSLYPKTETIYTFKPYMNDVFVNNFNNQTSNHDGNENAFSKKYILQSIKSNISTFTNYRKSFKKEVNRKRHGYIIDTLTSVDI